MNETGKTIITKLAAEAKDTPEHTTTISRVTRGRAVLTKTVGGIRVNTRTEVSPAGDGLVRIQINQFAKFPHHKRGLVRNIEFIISDAGWAYLHASKTGQKFVRQNDAGRRINAE